MKLKLDDKCSFETVDSSADDDDVYYCNFRFKMTDSGTNIPEIHVGAILDLYCEKENCTWTVEVTDVVFSDGPNVRGQCSLQLLSKSSLLGSAESYVGSIPFDSLMGRRRRMGF